jgi:two-component system chemotaxis response regulator CheY
MKIWLIDDDNITNMLNRYFLEEHYPSLEIRSFIYASEALEELKQGGDNPNFILLDINMPGMNGWEFLDGLQQSEISSSKLPIIYMLSSSLDPEDEAKARKSALVKGFISKQLEVEKLPFLNG